LIAENGDDPALRHVEQALSVRPDISDRIGLPYGSWDGKTGFGYAKLVEKHPEVLDNLPGLLSAMRIKSRSNNRILLESENHKAVVSLTYFSEEKTWLMTAYEKTQSANSGGAEESRSLLDQGAAPRPRTNLNSSQRPQETTESLRNDATAHPRNPSTNRLLPQDQTGSNPNNDIKHGAPL